MNQDEILQQVGIVVSGFLTGGHEKKGDVEKQVNLLSELLGMLRMAEVDYAEVVLLHGRKLLKRRKLTVMTGCINPLLQAVTAAFPTPSEDSNLQRLSISIRSAFLQHVTDFHLSVQQDTLFQGRRTLEATLQCLQRVAEAASWAFPHDESLYHLIHNGTVHLCEFASVFSERKLFKEAVLALGFGIECCNCTVLASTRWLPWRTRLYLSAAAAYELMGCPADGAGVLQHALREISDLSALEHSDDVPPPPATVRTLDSCAHSLQCALFKHVVVSQASADLQASPGKPKDASKPAAGFGSPEALQQCLAQVLTGASAAKAAAAAPPSAQLPLAHIRALLYTVASPQLAPATFAAAVAHLEKLFDELLDTPADSDEGGDVADSAVQLLGEFVGQLSSHDEFEKCQAWAPRALQCIEICTARRTSLRADSSAASAAGRVLRQGEDVTDLKSWLLSVVSHLQPSSSILKYVSCHVAVRLQAAVSGTQAARPGDMSDLQYERQKRRFFAEVRLLLELVCEVFEASRSDMTEGGTPVLLLPKDLLANTCMTVYDTLTQKGDEETINQLRDDSFEVLCSVCHTLLAIEYLELTFTCSAVLLCTRWLTGPTLTAAGDGQRRKRQLQHAVFLLQKLQAQITSRRESFIVNRPDTPRSEAHGSSARADLPPGKPDEPVVSSDSLLYKTLSAQAVEVEAVVVKAQMEIGIASLHAKTWRQHNAHIATLRTRVEQSHIYGEPSAKEAETIRKEAAKDIEEPPLNHDMERHLLLQRAGSPTHCALAFLVVAEYANRVSPAEARLRLTKGHAKITEAAAIEHRRKARLAPASAPGEDLITPCSLPVDMLWAKLATASLACKQFDLAMMAADVLKEKYVSTGAEGGLGGGGSEVDEAALLQMWARNPFSAAVLRKELVAVSPTVLVESVASAFMAAADAAGATQSLPSRFNDDPDSSFDPARYKRPAVQQSCFASGNMLLIALQLGRSTQSNTVITTCCNKLYNAIGPLLETAVKPAALLRPLVLMLRVLLPLKGPFLNDTRFQSLLIRLLYDVFDTMHRCRDLSQASGAAAANAMQRTAVNLLVQLWKLLESNPTLPIQHRALKAVNFRLRLGLSDTSAEASSEPSKAVKKGKPDKEGGAKSDTQCNPLPATTFQGPQESLPMEFLDLVDFVLLNFPASVTLLSEKSLAGDGWQLPRIYQALSNLHTNPQQAFEEIQQNYKCDPLYAKMSALIISAACTMCGKQVNGVEKVQGMIEAAMAGIDERRKSLKALEITVLQPLTEAQLRTKKGDARPPSQDPLGKGKGKPAKVEAVSDEPPEVLKQKKVESMVKWACLSLVKKRKASLLHALQLHVSHCDVPYQAKLNEMLSAVFLSKALRQQRARVDEPAATAPGEDWSPTANKKVAAKKEEHQQQQQQQSVPPPAAPKPEEYWQHTTKAIQAQSRAVVLYARILRWKHMYNAVIALHNALNLSFFENPRFLKNHEYLPQPFPLPNEALPQDPNHQPLPGLVAKARQSLTSDSEEEEATLEEGLSLCRSAVRSSFEQAVLLVEEMYKKRLDFRDYLCTLNPSCIEVFATAAPKGSYERELAIACSTSLRVAMGAEGKAALASSRGRDEARLRDEIDRTEEEFRARAAVESEEDGERRALLRMATGAEDDEAGRQPEKSADTGTTVVGGHIYYKARLLSDVDACLRSHRDRQSRFVKGFPKDIYETAGVHLDVVDILEMTQCREIAGEMRVGAVCAQRKVGAKLATSRLSDQPMRSTGEQLLASSAAPGEGGELLPATFYNIGNAVVVMRNIDTGAESKLPVEDAFKHRGDHRTCYLKEYVLVRTKKIRRPGDAEKGAETLAPPAKSPDATSRKQAILALLPEPPKDGPSRAEKSQARPVASANEAPVDVRSTDVKPKRLLEFAACCMHALQYCTSLSSQPAAVVYALKLNDLFNGAYADQLLPLVMRYQARIGRKLSSTAELLSFAHRDLPRAVALVRAGEVALQEYYNSTTWMLAQGEVERERENRGCKASSTGKTSSGKKRSVIRNEYYKEIANRFNLAYAYLRQRHMTLPAMQVVNTLGQLHKDHLATKDASRSWQEGVDMAFACVNAWQSWREILRGGSGEPPIVARLGTSRVLLTIILLHKQASQLLSRDQHAQAEHCLLGAALVHEVMQTCLSHPTRLCDYATFMPREILIHADVFYGPLGVDAQELMHALAYIADFCQSINHHLLSLPAAALLEFVAMKVMRSAEYTLLARCLRLHALSELGNIEDASVELCTILLGTKLPDKAFMQIPVEDTRQGSGTAAPPTSSEQVKRPAKPTKAAKQEVPDATQSPSEKAKLLNSRMLSSDDKPVLDSLAQKLPESTTAEVPESLARFFYLVQAMFFLKLGSTHPLLVLEAAQKEDNPYSCALTHCDNIAAMVTRLTEVDLSSKEQASARSQLCRAKFIVARSAALRGNLKKAYSLLTQLLKFVAGSRLSSFANEAAEASISFNSLAHVSSWLCLESEVLLQLRCPEKAIEVSKKCEALCAQHRFLHGERQAKLTRAQAHVALGQTSEALALVAKPQSESLFDTEDNNRQLPDFGPLARTGCPTRLLTEPSAHSKLTPGGGLLEGTPVSVLQVDYQYTLVKTESGKQGFVATCELKPGLHALPRQPPPARRRRSMVEEAHTLDYRCCDPFLPKLLLFVSRVDYLNSIQGRLDTQMTLLCKPLVKPTLDTITTDTSSLVNKAASFSQQHIAHLGIDSSLDGSTQRALFNSFSCADSRLACISYILSGHDHCRRNNLQQAERWYAEAMQLSSQCMDALPYCQSVALYFTARCRRMQFQLEMGYPKSASESLLSCVFNCQISNLADVSTQEALALTDEMDPKLQSIVPMLTKCIEIDTTKGVHDHSLLSHALMELCFVFGLQQSTPAISVAVHCLTLACTFSTQQKQIVMPQSSNTPLTMSFCKEDRGSTLKDPDSVLLPTHFTDEVAELYRRTNTEQRAFEKTYDEVEIATTLKWHHYSKWHRLAVLAGFLTEDMLPELRLMVWRNYVQQNYPNCAGIYSAPSSTWLTEGVLGTAGLQQQGNCCKSFMYPLHEQPLPPELPKPGEPVCSLPSLPPVYWFVYLRYSSDIEKTSETPGGSGAKKGDKKKASVSAAPGAPDEGTHSLQVIVLDQRENRKLLNTCKHMRSVVAKQLERDEELTVSEEMLAPLSGTRKSDDSTSKLRGSENAALHAEMDELRVVFAETMQKVFQTFRRVSGSRLLEEEDTQALVYPPCSLRDGKSLLHIHSILGLLVELFSPSGGTAIAPTHQGASEIFTWLAGLLPLFSKCA
ncbi:Cilia- and flagella-associated protein 54 [Diplonema papillatum]|nr:Cilia- and flagella-associated protein 54 [Diplonema papillatum]